MGEQNTHALDFTVHERQLEFLYISLGIEYIAILGNIGWEMVHK